MLLTSALTIAGSGGGTGVRALLRELRPALDSDFLALYGEKVSDYGWCRRLSGFDCLSDVLDRGIQTHWHGSYSDIIDRYVGLANPILFALKSGNIEEACLHLDAGAHQDSTRAVFRDKRALYAELSRMTGIARQALRRMEDAAPSHVAEKLRDFSVEDITFEVDAKGVNLSFIKPHKAWGHGQIRASRKGVLEFLAEMDHLMEFNAPSGTVLPMPDALRDVVDAVGNHPLTRVQLFQSIGKEWDTTSLFNRNVLEGAPPPDEADLRSFDEVSRLFFSGQPGPFPVIRIGADFFLKPADGYQPCAQNLCERFHRDRRELVQKRAGGLTVRWLGISGHAGGLEGAFMESQAVCEISGACFPEAGSLLRQVFSKAVRIGDTDKNGRIIVSAGYGAPEEDLRKLSHWAQGKVPGDILSYKFT